MDNQAACACDNWICPHNEEKIKHLPGVVKGVAFLKQRVEEMRQYWQTAESERDTARAEARKAEAKEADAWLRMKAAESNSAKWMAEWDEMKKEKILAQSRAEKAEAELAEAKKEPHYEMFCQWRDRAAELEKEVERVKHEKAVVQVESDGRFALYERAHKDIERLKEDLRLMTDARDYQKHVGAEADVRYRNAITALESANKAKDEALEKIISCAPCSGCIDIAEAALKEPK